MLVITAGHPVSKSGSWHIGETMHIPEGRVVIFQADGDELDAILTALEKAGIAIEYPSKHLTPIF